MRLYDLCSRFIVVSTVLTSPLPRAGAEKGAQAIELAAKDTITPVELDPGQSVRYALKNGEMRTLELVDTDCRILLSNLRTARKAQYGGGTVYMFEADVRVDGHPMKMRRYVPVQQSFYEPYVVNGLRIWFDAVAKVGEHFNENHGSCLPQRAARFVLLDASLSIAPQEIRPWYPNSDNVLDVHDCYKGDDAWMGPYHGADLHGGLDVNMPNGTPLWAPVDFDDHYYFDMTSRGANNNRWRGTRRWPNGDLWTLQVHHVAKPLVDEHTPLKRGKYYAVAAGEWLGSHAHSHFVFKVDTRGRQYLLDPWILFWQIFENNRRRGGEIDAAMDPTRPARTGEPVTFRAQRSRPSPTGVGLKYFWCFGDGGFSDLKEARHTFVDPGVYPVTLVVDDGTRRDRCTQHITVDGQALEGPALLLDAPEETTFRRRPVEAMDTYGSAARTIPHTLRFVARPKGRAAPSPKTIRLLNPGSQELPAAETDVRYHEGERYGWLRLERSGAGNEQKLTVSVDASKIVARRGEFAATVSVACREAINSPQVFRVELSTFRFPPPEGVITVDNEEPGCYSTPWFWFGPRFRVGWPAGHGETYLANGGRADSDQFVRFTPDLRKGRYLVELHEETPVRPATGDARDVRYHVRVRHAGGTDVVTLEPLKSRIVGTFDFDEGTDGYVQIEAHGSSGSVTADAIVFTPSPARLRQNS